MFQRNLSSCNCILIHQIALARRQTKQSFGLHRVKLPLAYLATEHGGIFSLSLLLLNV